MTILRFSSKIFSSSFLNKAVFFFDFDGTLTNIVQRPEDVKLKKVVRGIIEELAERFPVGVVSGRQLSELKRLVGIKNIFYSGNHGVEIEGPGFKFVEPRSARSSTYIVSLSKEIERKVRPYGARVNSKNYSVSVHYRSVDPHLVKRLLVEVEKILKTPVRLGRIDVFHGKKVVEIKAPVDWDKGKAIELITKRKVRHGRPVFFGDDTTDEYGFRKVNSLGGVSVFVGGGRRQTAAKYRIPSPADLTAELAKLLFELE